MLEFGYQLSLVPRDNYRHGIAACNAWCKKEHGKVFAELDKATQEKVLTDLQTGKVQISIRTLSLTIFPIQYL